jgi:hypothetical protein
LFVLPELLVEAVKVIVVPAYTLFAEDVIETVRTGGGKIFTVIAFEVTEDAAKQGPLTDNIHLTTSPSLSSALVKVLVFVPTFVLFTCH